MSRSIPQPTEISDPGALPADPLVSVLVPAYRHALYLEQCIQSIAQQVAPFAVEVVIAEDCSPDDTRAVAETLQRRHRGLVRLLFGARNLGSGLNTIIGIGRCRGRYIALCEGDDFWTEPNKLSRQVTVLEERPEVDLSFTRGYRLYPDGRRELDWNYGETARLVHTRELFAGQGWIAPTASLVFRAEVLRALPGTFVDSPAGDTMIMMAGSIRGGAWYEPEPTVCYRVGHSASFTAGLDAAPPEERIRFHQEVIRFIRSACAHYRVPQRYVRHRLDDYRLAIAKLRWRQKRPLEALKALSAIHPAFLGGGAVRRLKKRLGR